MLAHAALLATLVLASRGAESSSHPACPAGMPVSVAGIARACPALEVSGSVDEAGATLDPAFDVAVAPDELARDAAGNVELVGYGADGTALLALGFSANGPFHFYVPLSSAAAQSLVRLHLFAGNAGAERSALGPNEPAAEAISLDDSHFVFAWDARAFPSVRIAASPGGAPFASGSGDETFEQLTLAGPARRLYVDFSDGVRSQTRAVPVVGR